jgi:hypothetical protein
MRKNNRRSVRGSLLLEEGMLIGISVVLLSIILSMVIGLLGGVNTTLSSTGKATGDFLSTIAQKFEEIYRQIASFFHLQ